MMLSICFPILLGFVFRLLLSRGRLVNRRDMSCRDQPLSWPGGPLCRSLNHHSDPGSIGDEERRLGYLVYMLTG